MGEGDYIFYKNTLYALFAFVTFFLILNKTFNLKPFKIIYIPLLSLFVLATCYLASIKEIGMYSDFYQYRYLYNEINNFSHIFNLKGDYLFYFFFYILKSLKLSFQEAIFVLLLIYNTCIIFALKNFSKNNYIILFFIIISLFFYYSMSLNILRQGIGFGFFILGFSYYNKYKKLAYLFLIFGILSHISYLILLLLIITSKYIKKIKYVIAIFIISTFISILNINIFSYLPIQMEGRVNMAAEDYIEHYRTGFRFDFYVFNLFFLLVGLYINKYIIEDKENYRLILYSYILSTSFFILCFMIPFSDRFGLLSWIFIPLIISPILEKNLKVNHNIQILLTYFLFITLYIIF